jgi:hypothetical protein
MLASDGPRSVVVVLATARMVAMLAWAASLALFVLALILRRDLAEGARRLGARFRGGDAAPQ